MLDRGKLTKAKREACIVKTTIKKKKKGNKTVFTGNRFLKKTQSFTQLSFFWFNVYKAIMEATVYIKSNAVACLESQVISRGVWPSHPALPSNLLALSQWPAGSASGL